MKWLAGGVLVGLGVMTIARSVGVLVQASANKTGLLMSSLGLLIADLVISAGFRAVAGGALLLGRRPLGYAGGLGLLFVGSMLFVGLLVFLLLQPILTDLLRQLHSASVALAEQVG